jgi:hypothetical protein
MSLGGDGDVAELGWHDEWVHRGSAGGEQEGAAVAFDHVGQDLLRRSEPAVEVVVELGLDVVDRRVQRSDHLAMDRPSPGPAPTMAMVGIDEIPSSKQLTVDGNVSRGSALVRAG